MWPLLNRRRLGRRVSAEHRLCGARAAAGCFSAGPQKAKGARVLGIQRGNPYLRWGIYYYHGGMKWQQLI